MYKTRLTYFTFLFLCFSFSGFSQNHLSDDKQKLRAENDLLETANLHKNNGSNNFSPSEPVTSSVLLGDLDDDGMDDNWETDNGLDPTNPKDAWADADNDLILNLFEFQLETDPNDGDSPTVFELSPADGNAALDDLIDAAENDIRVIRLAQGDYNAEVLAVYYEDFKIMIQGGWNDDFTEHDPKLYPTNWFGLNSQALNILIPVDNETVTESAIILEGVNFKAADYFFLGGAVSLSINSGSSAISLYNCTMNSNTYYGLALFHKFQTDSAQVFIVNTVIGNNSSGGVYTQITNEAYSRWRLFNTTINNPESEEGGFDGLTAGQGKLRFELTNCINWGNNNYSFNFFSFNDVEVTTINSNVDQTVPDQDISDLGNSINANPLFHNVMENEWTLDPDSPCIDTGVDVGLAFSGSAPNMGALETHVMSNIEEGISIEGINIFPNPFTNFIWIEIDEAIGQEVEIGIFDVIGNSLHTEQRIISGKLEIETKHLPRGLLILNLKINHKQYFHKMFKN